MEKKLKKYKEFIKICEKQSPLPELRELYVSKYKVITNIDSGIINILAEICDSALDVKMVDVMRQTDPKNCPNLKLHSNASHEKIWLNFLIKTIKEGGLFQ